MYICRIKKTNLINRMNKTLTFFALMFSLTMGAQNNRESVLLNEGWRFSLGNASDPAKDFGNGTEYFNYLTKAHSIHNEGPYSDKFDDSAWQEVRVPHDWVTTLPYASNASHSHGYKAVGYRFPETSVGWYRKIIHVGKEDMGKHLMLRFDGIFRDAKVWFNGVYMGTEPSGYATQVYDVSDYVNYDGDNLICVRADATFEEGWFYEGAGIYRDVWLEKRSEVGVAPFGTFVYSDIHSPYQSAVMTVETEVNNASLKGQSCTVMQKLVDAEGKEIAHSELSRLTLAAKQTGSCKQIMKVQNPHLWSIDAPYLYKVITTISVDGNVVDEYSTTTGIREVVFDAEKGFMLNGKQMKLKGVNCHQDHAGVGAAIPDALQAYRIRALKEFGCNAYRASHNPMTPALLDICDREGILCIDENRLMGVNAEHLRQLEMMIKRDRNHPSVILWSDGNEEWGLENNDMGVRIAASMREYTHLLDPTRHSTAANAGGTELIKSLDVVGFNYIIQNDVMNRHKQHPDWKIVGTEETSGCGTRGVYEFMKDEKKAEGHMQSINRSGEKGVMNVIERGWRFYAENEWAAGVFYWTGFDYRGEPTPFGYPATDSEFGILDYCGFWKDEAWYLQSWWTDKTTLHVFPHWNLQGHEGEEVDVWVYSNCEEVELVVNGKKLERKQMPKNGHLSWKTVYQPGKVIARGYTGGKLVKTDVVETTGVAAKMQIKADRTSISADGRDVAVMNISMLDAKGRFVPDASNGLTFTLEGEGRIIGVGNGDPAYLGEDHPKDINCKSFSIPAFNGCAQVIVQSTKQQGGVVVTCSADGVKAAKVALETK